MPAPTTAKAETVPVRRFAGAEHAERMVSHLERQIERAEQSAAALRTFAQGANGDVYISTHRYADGDPHIQLFSGSNARWSAICDAGAGYLGTIILHPSGTWEPVELFPEHGR